jgi:hypothetical protein
MRRLSASVALLLAPVPLLAAISALGPFALTVPARGFEEHCFELAAGVRVRYRFRASDAVDFNLHYHRGTDVVYPVRAAATQAHEGVYTAPLAEAYCLMWERKADGAVRVDGTVERVAR